LPAPESGLQLGCRCAGRRQRDIEELALLEFRHPRGSTMPVSVEPVVGMC